MFQFPSFPSLDYGFIKWSLILHQRGFPIRKSADRSLFAAPRSLSQLVTSFVGSWCQGIHLVLFFTWTSLFCFLFAWVSQIICLQWKSFFLITLQSGIFRFRLRNAIHWIARNILTRCSLYFKFALTHAPCCAFLFLGSPALSSMRPNCSFPRFSERPSKLFC